MLSRVGEGSAGVEVEAAVEVDAECYAAVD
jgi:hypothetical protein